MEIKEETELEKENKLILKHYRVLLRSLRDNVSRQEKKSIRQAFELAMESHKEMRRKSGEPYILHPLEVSRIVVRKWDLMLLR